VEDKSGLGRNAISLPQGGGAAVGEGDAFQVDQLRGTGSYSIPISIPKARGRLALSLNLTYSSDVGFGPIGLGWDLNVASIRRRLDTGVPTYNDDDDVFTFDGEELLKVGPNHYRCRIEKNYWRIERVGNGWKVHDRSGNLYVLGESANSQVFNPANQVEVQAWMLDRLEDPNGNVIQYSYRRDAQTISLAPQLSFQAARLYLDKIEYNPHESGWLNRIQLVYDYDGPTESPRSDAYLSYRAGFPIYTAWRLSRIEVHADIPGEFNGRVRSYALDYQADPDCGLALLSAIQITGFNVDGTSEDLPPITFNYSQLDVSAAEVERLEGAPPIDLAAGNTELVDLTGNGLPDILNTLSGAHTFWLNNSWRQSENLGPGERHFAPGTAMAASPDITLSQPAAHLADVRGRVATDLLSDTIILDSPSYAVTRDDILARNLSWGAATRFAVPPPFNFQDGRARVVDLTGRGRMDVLRAEQGFRHWLNRPDGTYEDRGMSPQIPGLSFLSSEWTFADLNGDGLADIVRVRNGRIEYYLNRGAGHRSDDLFEPVPIVMDNGIALRQGQTEWDPERLIFVDLNGDGFDDAVYLHSDRSIYWINQGGRAWSDAHEVPLTENGAPINLTTNRASVRVGDILGSGTRQSTTVRQLRQTEAANGTLGFPLRCMWLKG
jgi:hypothetical protein